MDIKKIEDIKEINTELIARQMEFQGLLTFFPEDYQSLERISNSLFRASLSLSSMVVSLSGAHFNSSRLHCQESIAECKELIKAAKKKKQDKDNYIQELLALHDELLGPHERVDFAELKQVVYTFDCPTIEELRKFCTPDILKVLKNDNVFQYHPLAILLAYLVYYKRYSVKREYPSTPEYLKAMFHLLGISYGDY